MASELLNGSFKTATMLWKFYTGSGSDSVAYIQSKLERKQEEQSLVRDSLFVYAAWLRAYH